MKNRVIDFLSSCSPSHNLQSLLFINERWNRTLNRDQTRAAGVVQQQKLPLVKGQGGFVMSSCHSCKDGDVSEEQTSVSLSARQIQWDCIFATELSIQRYCLFLLIYNFIFVVRLSAAVSWIHVFSFSFIWTQQVSLKGRASRIQQVVGSPCWRPSRREGPRSMLSALLLLCWSLSAKAPGSFLVEMFDCAYPFCL